MCPHCAYTHPRDTNDYGRLPTVPAKTRYVYARDTLFPPLVMLRCNAPLYKRGVRVGNGHSGQKRGLTCGNVAATRGHP